MTQLFQTRRKHHILYMVIMVSMVSGCVSSQRSNQALTTPNQQAPQQFVTEQIAAKEASFFSIYNQWQGVPYRLGGTNKSGIDCSAFVQIAYRDAWKLPLPRTTTSQSKIGENINYNKAKYGDLVFFRTSRTTKHVGVYLGNLRFMHASTSKGVIISRLDNPYWASKFWQFRRVDTQTY